MRSRHVFHIQLISSLVVMLSTFLVVPDIANAQFVPCSGLDCNACHFVAMGNTILNWLIGILFLVFAFTAFVAGWGMVTSGGNVSALSDAKQKMVNAFIGILLVLSAWLIVDTLMKALLNPVGPSGPNPKGWILNYGPWNSISCDGGQVTPMSIDPAIEDTSAVAATTPSSYTPSATPTCNPSTPGFPGCLPTVTTNDNMNPLLDCSSGGCSSMVRAGAEARMQETLNGPFAALQASFGQSLVINDAIAKNGTSRETKTPNSRHFYGDAIDISLAGMNDADRLRLVQEAQAAGFTGFGLGNNILHIDRRPGPPVAWDYGNATYGGQSAAALEAQIEGG